MKKSSYIFKPYSFDKSNHPSDYFDDRPSFSYGTKVVGWIGARGIGKTFKAKKYCIRNFIEHNIMFVWLRDSEEARKKLASNNGAKFFSDVPKMKLPYKVSGVIDGETIRINGKTAGYLMPSSTFQNYKGNDYDLIQIIVADEFIAEKNRSNRGSRSWEMINSLYTIARLKNMKKILFLANALERGDETLQFLGLKIKDFGLYINRDKDVCFHYCDNSPAFNKMRDESTMGRLIKGTAFEDNLFNNKFSDDENLFYDKRPSLCKLQMILEDDENSIRIYSNADGKLYICHDFSLKARDDVRYTTDYKYVDTRHALLSKPLKDAIVLAYTNKLCMFDNAFTKNSFIRMTQGKSQQSKKSGS